MLRHIPVANEVEIYGFLLWYRHHNGTMKGNFKGKGEYLYLIDNEWEKYGAGEEILE